MTSPLISVSVHEELKETVLLARIASIPLHSAHTNPHPIGGVGWEQGLGVVGDCVVGKMAWQERDWERDGSAMGLGSARRNEDG